MQIRRRRGGVTEHKCPPQVWGVDQMKGWLSPYLPMGPGARENRFGNLHAQTGSATGSAAAGSMAFSTLGDTFTGKRVVINGTVSGGSGQTLTVNSIVSGSSDDIVPGMVLLYDVWQNNDNAVATSIASGTYPTFTLQNNVAGNNATSVQITLVERYLGIDGQPAFSRVPAPDDPTKMCLRYRTLFDDMRPSGQAWGGGLRKVISRFGDSGSEASNGAGIVQPIGTYYLDVFAIYIPAATREFLRRAGSVLLDQHKNSTGQPGLALFSWPGLYHGSGPNIGYGTKDEPRLVLRTWNTATTDNVLVVPNYPGDQWLYIAKRVRPHATNGSAHTQVWSAVGNASATKVGDHTGGNAENASADTNRQFGWYVFDDESNYYNDGTYNASAAAWWQSGDEMNFYLKDYLVAPQWRADVEPPLWLVDQWFDVMRAR